MLIRRAALGSSVDVVLGGSHGIKGVASAGSASVTLPSHVSGDLIIVFAYRDGSTTQPTLPAGFTAISNAIGANTNSSTLGYKVAASGSETSGTWTNASAILAVVVSTSVDHLIGASAANSGSSKTITYPALTLGGTNMVLCFAGHRAINVAVEAPPYGMLRVGSFQNATCELACHATNGKVSSFSSVGSPNGGGTISGFRSHSVELVP